jgi:hypothetical protein
MLSAGALGVLMQGGKEIFRENTRAPTFSFGLPPTGSMSQV